MARRVAKRLVKAVGVVVVVTILLGLAGVAWLRHENRPATGDLAVTGLQGPVDVTRDAWGVPHIRAGTDADAVYALGFVHWQDRSWQMEFQRRIAAGRLSEVLGEAGLEQDRFLRTMGFRRVAEQALPALRPRTRELVAAYTAGVNAAMEHTAPAPEFRLLGITPEPWTDVDAVSWSQLMSYDLATNYVDEVRAAQAYALHGQAGIESLYPPVQPGEPTILSPEETAQSGLDGDVTPVPSEQVSGPAGAGVAVPVAETDVTDVSDTDRAEAHAAASAGAAAVRATTALGMEPVAGKGSNNWVVDGSRTESGAPILADDPHLALNSPMLWYLADVQGDELSAIGASIPGLPAIVIGRTPTFAWGVTNVGADVQDLYVEPDGADLTSRTEVITVRGLGDVEHVVRESSHGPIVSDVGVSDEPDPEVTGGTESTDDAQEEVPQRTLALRWVALDPGDTTMDAFLDLNYAASVEEGVEALRRYVSPSQNFVLADAEGSIGYYAPGRLPVRDWEGHLPVPADGSHEWSGYVPFEDLPHVIDPADGMVVSANNNPMPLEHEGPVLAGPRVWADPYRAHRIVDLLGERTDLDVDAMRRIQNDVHSSLWNDVAPMLLAARPLDDRGRAALELLREWDGDTSRDSVGATIFETWWAHLRHIASDELGDDVALRSSAVTASLEQGVFCPDASTGETTCEEALSRALQRATDQLTDRFGPDLHRWRWGDVHEAVHAHGAFGDIPVLRRIFSVRTPTAGGTETVAPALPGRDDLSQAHGAGYRQIVDLADPDASRYIGSLGQGGSPWHPHRTDQMRLWREGEDIPMSTRTEDWGSTTSLRLTPGGGG